MKIYLAGRVSRRPILQQWAALLEQDGHEIVSRWSKRGSDHIKQTGLSERAANAERERFAREDIEDIRICDCMLSLMEKPRAGGRGGRHVEFGFGLALGKPQIIVGERETVFHHMAGIHHCDDFEQARFALQVLAYDEAGPCPMQGDIIDPEKPDQRYDASAPTPAGHCPTDGGTCGLGGQCDVCAEKGVPGEDWFPDAATHSGEVSDE